MRDLIGLAARTFDPEGTLLVPHLAGTRPDDLSRRVSRVATLDGGASISDRGHSAADRTVIVSLAGQPQAMVERARRMLRVHGAITVSMRDGCFTATPESYNGSRQELTVLISGTA